MRIEKARTSGISSKSSKASAAGDRAAFASALGAGSAIVSAQSTSASTGVSSVAALMALQGVDDVTEKKKRVARRGRQLLEGLDRLKIDILEGRDPLDTLSDLRTALQSAREDSGETQLESLIDQIELRVEVELAKREKTHQF